MLDSVDGDVHQRLGAEQLEMPNGAREQHGAAVTVARVERPASGRMPTATGVPVGASTMSGQGRPSTSIDWSPRARAGSTLIFGVPMKWATSSVRARRRSLRRRDLQESPSIMTATRSDIVIASA